jgi:hypothetical protein
MVSTVADAPVAVALFLSTRPGERYPATAIAAES